MAGLKGITIRDICDLKEYFHNSKTRMTDSVYVGADIRKSWMLNHERTIIGGTVYDIVFKNLGGGVWEASLKV